MVLPYQLNLLDDLIILLNIFCTSQQQTRPFCQFIWSPQMPLKKEESGSDKQVMFDGAVCAQQQILPTLCCFDIVWSIFKSLMPLNASSPCPCTLHLWCHHLSMNPQPKTFSLLLHRLKLGRVRTECLRLSLLQELPVLLNVLRNMCDQPAGCGLVCMQTG